VSAFLSQPECETEGLYLASASLAFPGVQANAQSTPAATSRPNVVLIITDDESWFERGIYGISGLPSPHFGQVANRGHASAPSCAPSRASILTGRNFWELEQGAFIQAWLPNKFETMTQFLGREGYAIGQTGKVYSPAVRFPFSQNTDLIEDVRETLLPAPPAPEMSRVDYAGSLQSFLRGKAADAPFLCDREKEGRLCNGQTAGPLR